ncbi:hypothetical protein OESDEN_24307 [Oesophagostomum dentatum]|uniref:Uncharacterized protein n=1 Tax=Oesophagostomum dentatum TaxID=61180 RepID=A0A0B1RTT2_OESDE|nr:hypothetical protein OESDEN_24307 [Oesophagostomum dentatum]
MRVAKAEETPLRTNRRACVHVYQRINRNVVEMSQLLVAARKRTRLALMAANAMWDH